MKTILVSVLLALLCTVSVAQEAREPEGVITVSGTSQVFAAPDEAVVRLGVMQQAPTAHEAQDLANSVIQKLIAAVTKLGIAEKNIQTARMSLNPIYNQPRPGEAMKITGYQAQDVLSVRLSDFPLIGKVIDAGIAAGVNTLEGIDFGLRNSRAARASAYKDAVADARSKADAIADALGLKIASVYDVRTEGGYVPQPRMMGAMKMDMAAETPVQPGELELSVTVTIRYRLK
jgi:uncharacterized protein YggE